MTYHLFSKGIKNYQDFNTYLDNLKDAGFDIFDTALIEKAYFVFDTWIESILNEEGQDLMYWWLFEDVDKIIYENGKPDTNVEKLEDLYAYMQNSDMFTV